MKTLRAFISGIVLPSILLPIFLCFALKIGKPRLMTISFLHILPLIWGFWNVLYFSWFIKVLPRNVNLRYFVTGGVLGLLVAIYGVFQLHIPVLLGLSIAWYYPPLLIVPIVYAILWRYVVRPLNGILGLGGD